MEQVRSGSTDAVWRLIEDYGPHIQRVVRRRLDQRMRSKFDSQDFVQMVWASFFRNPVEMSSFDEPEDLLRYLSAMARHKVVNEHRRRIVHQKHNITPAGIKKEIYNVLASIYEADYFTVPAVAEPEAEYASLEEIPQVVEKLRQEMHEAAQKLEFERAAQLRDRIKHLEEMELALG